MKGSCLSLNRIYGDPQLLALNTRIKFLKTKNNNMRLPVEISNISEGQSVSGDAFDRKEKLIKRKSMILQKKGVHNSIEKGEREDSNKVRLRVLKSQRYKQAKENSEMLRLKIQKSKEKDITLKRIKYREIVRQQQRGRMILQDFQEEKIGSIRREQSHKKCLMGRIELKRIELKRQLMEEQTRSLHQYQQSLSLKSELMSRIKELIKEQS